MSTLSRAVRDSTVVARRNLIKIKRVPDLLVFTLLSPIMFVLLFVYVFGSAIPIEGVDYAQFLMAGIFAQTVVFGATITGAGLAEDMQKGIIDRFRSLPMSRQAVLAGRTASDVVNNVLVLIVMSITGLAVGWRITSSPLDAIVAYALLLLFAYAISWMMAYIGLLVPSPEVVNNASFLAIFPLTFIAETFVPTDGFPVALRTFARWNPVSAVTQAAREGFGNTGGVPAPDTWSMQNPEIYTLIWVVIIIVVFAPLASRQYQRTTERG
ncbi:ABC transporter permease [Euzebya sp.]|uniref:ABC transporter permease n=1 Tax=Euzebya sp. TaxID=1971409 RepID=UPI0035195B28